MIANDASFIDVAPAEFPAANITGDDLNMRMYYCLLQNGIDNWQMFPYIGSDFLLDIRNFGKKSLNEVLMPELRRRGLRLKDVE
jgi:DNA-directed RNA polymerase alpha subunit